MTSAPYTQMRTILGAKMSDITLNATDQYLLEVAIETGTAQLASLANLHDRMANPAVADAVRLSLNSFAVAREVMARAGSTVRDFSKQPDRARDIGFEAVARGFSTTRPRDLDAFRAPPLADISVTATDQPSSTEGSI